MGVWTGSAVVAPPMPMLTGASAAAVPLVYTGGGVFYVLDSTGTVTVE